MKKWVKQISVPQLIVEFASIVFAVSLALGMNAYKDTQDFKTEALVLQQKIILECRRNLAELDTVYRNNLEFKETLDSLAALDKIESNFSIAISSELLTKTAWDFTKASRSFSYIDEGFLNEAARVYERQEYYMHISNQLFQNLGDLLISDPAPEKTVSVSNYYMLNYNATTEALHTIYNEFLAEYDK
jgi:hypothetical protein